MTMKPSKDDVLSGYSQQVQQTGCAKIRYDFLGHLFIVAENRCPATGRWRYPSRRYSAPGGVPPDGVDQTGNATAAVGLNLYLVITGGQHRTHAAPPQILGVIEIGSGGETGSLTVPLNLILTPSSRPISPAGGQLPRQLSCTMTLPPSTSS